MTSATMHSTRDLTRRLIRDATDGKIVIGPPFQAYGSDTRPLFVVAGSGPKGFWQACIVLADSESYAKIVTGLERKRTVHRIADPDELTALCHRLWPCAETLRQLGATVH